VVLLIVAVLAPSAAARVDIGERLHFIWPAKGTVTAPFGEWRGHRRHEGVDIGMLKTLKVRAAVAGRVSQVGYLDGYEGYGKLVVVNIGRGYQLLYAHLSSSRVRHGQRVAKGQLLGLAGCTGSCSGTHLHFELRKRGAAVNPAPFLRGLG
jgi:murein DD-endopeptidase MepM/ murein hydrolase activator NlpD